MNKKFCDRMKRLRNESGKTQGEMAELLGVQRSTYGEYERGKIMPPVEKLEQLAKIFHVRPSYLIGWDSEELADNLGESKLAETIKRLREEKQKTLFEMSQEIEIPFEMLSQYEKGTRKIPYTALKKIAKYFGVDITLLYGMEFDTGLEEKQELKEGIKRLKMAETWNREIGKAIFDEEELAELINYAKYIISKRNK